MSQTNFHRDSLGLGGAPSTHQHYDYGLILLLLMFSLRTSDATAAEQALVMNFSHSVSSRETLLTPPSLSIPAAYRPIELPELESYSSRDFRPRGRSVFDGANPVGSADQTPMLRGTTVWQRLAEYRTHGRVRLLTLWEGGASTVSLQAGKKGEPSLQWTSRLMNHGGATRGVLDQLMSFSVTGAGRSFHLPSRAPTQEVSVRPKQLDLGVGAMK